MAGDHADPVPTSAAVIELGRFPTIQLAYEVGWDDDHILGACPSVRCISASPYGIAERTGGLRVDELIPKDPRAGCRLRCNVNAEIEGVET